MAMLDTQNMIAEGVLAGYDRPIAVSVMSKATKFPFLQELGYNGQLGWLQKGFLGLQDFYEEMTAYSSVSPLLTAAWALISPRVPFNLLMLKNLYVTPALGMVGNAFLALVGFDQVFAVDPDQLTKSTAGALTGV